MSIFTRKIACFYFTSKIADTSSNWNEINQYLGVNDHLKGINRGKAAPKSGLEETIDEAITLGEFNTAEKLSDRLATREVFLIKKIKIIFVHVSPRNEK